MRLIIILLSILLISCVSLNAETSIRNRYLDTSVIYWGLFGYCSEWFLNDAGAPDWLSIGTPVFLCIGKELLVDKAGNDIFGEYDEPDEIDFDGTDIGMTLLCALISHRQGLKDKVNISYSKKRLSLAVRL